MSIGNVMPKLTDKSLVLSSPQFTLATEVVEGESLG
jgi:hypothetical protein